MAEKNLAVAAMGLGQMNDNLDGSMGGAALLIQVKGYGWPPDTLHRP